MTLTYFADTLLFIGKEFKMPKPHVPKPRSRRSLVNKWSNSSRPAASKDSWLRNLNDTLPALLLATVARSWVCALSADGGSCIQHATAENFVARLERELNARNSWQTTTEARLAVLTLFPLIESWCNPRRRHSGLGHMSLFNFESKERTKLAQDTEIIPIIITRDLIPQKI